ncbi:MAG: type IV secretory system conjugative DNA transfer family protein, partial [Vicinamibacteria bacterium]
LRLGRVGELNPAQLVASEEDVLLMIAGPRSNKTSAVVVPAALSAPGPVIVTSNKVDVYTLTVGLRAAAGRTTPVSGGLLAEAAAAANLGLEECLHAAGDSRRDGAMEEGARRLLAQGADRLPALRVGRVLFAGEDRMSDAHAAAQAPALRAG